jgi:ABC-type multidrug transport system ATPase subunit
VKDNLFFFLLETFNFYEPIVMGASASGKSLLLQSLSGRVQDLDISGKCFINGKEVNPKKLDNPIAYVPQDDSVIGELTAREVAMNSAVLKRNEPREQLAKDVDILLESLGLSKVADGIIGTLIFVRLTFSYLILIPILTNFLVAWS